MLNKLPKWATLNASSKKKCFAGIVSAFESFLKVMNKDAPALEQVCKENKEKLKELEQVFTKKTITDDQEDSDQVAMCDNLKGTLLRFCAVKSGLKSLPGSPITCLKNILFQLDLIRDGLKHGQNQDMKRSKVSLLPQVERASELSLELLTTLDQKKLRSHNFEDYRVVLQGTLSPEGAKALDALVDFNFGNRSHYLHRDFGKKSTEARGQFEVYKEVQLAENGMSTDPRGLDLDKVDALSDSFDECFQNLSVLVNEVIRVHGQANKGREQGVVEMLARMKV